MAQVGIYPSGDVGYFSIACCPVYDIILYLPGETLEVEHICGYSDCSCYNVLFCFSTLNFLSLPILY